MGDIVSGDTGHVTEHNRLRRQPTGNVALDSFDGTTDTLKLSSAMSYCAAQTYPPAIQLANRLHTFTAQLGSLYTGFRLVGPCGGIMNSEISGAEHMSCQVQLSGINGPWLYAHASTDVYDLFVSGIGFWGDSGTTFMGGDGSAVFRGSHLRDLSFHQFKSILGTQTQKCTFVASVMDGWIQSQGTYNGGYHIGGSDNKFCPTEWLIDSNTTYLSAGGATGQFHIWCDGFDNSVIGGLYMTAEAGWGGIKVTGSAYNASGPPGNLGMCEFISPTVEGRSASAPCDGALWRIEGGIVKIRGGYTARGMFSPSTMGHTPADAGIIHVTGGGVLVDGVTYDRYTAQSETVPFVYNNGGTVRVRDIYIASKGGVWSGLPRTSNVSGSMNIDNSVTAI